MVCLMIDHKFAQAECFSCCVCCKEPIPHSSGFCTVCGRLACNKCLEKGECTQCRFGITPPDEASSDKITQNEQETIPLVPEDQDKDPFTVSKEIFDIKNTKEGK